MSMEFTKSKMYKPPNQGNWKGRASDPSLGPQYWYQSVKCVGLDALGSVQTDAGIIGYVCDEGVRRNLGRTGAREAPDVFRSKLGKLPVHHKAAVADVGNMVCQGEDLEGCQQIFSDAIHKMLAQGVFPIAIGGGHDIAYAHFRGVKQSLGGSQAKVGILNFDAHFDLRPWQGESTSGTPFTQILSEYEKGVNYLAVGIQQSGNTKELFEIANRKGVKYLLSEDCTVSGFDRVEKELETFIRSCDHVYLTIDMDGFSSAYAPGVSAPSPLGFNPAFMISALRYLFASGKVISCDIAEINPTFDQDDATIYLATRLVDLIMEVLKD